MTVRAGEVFKEAKDLDMEEVIWAAREREDARIFDCGIHRPLLIPLFVSSFSAAGLFETGDCFHRSSGSA
jgi:hypothetical protein